MIDILLATYNGEQFLPEQLDSIINQNYRDWHLYICDDGSTDRTCEIAAEYAEKNSDRITFYRNSAPSGSACANFMGMLGKSAAEYIMFCDQDDVWRHDKVSATLDKMRELEKQYPDSPLLVHTDMEIVTAELAAISASFTAYQGIKPQYNTLNRLLTQNNITGCTVMLNSRLADIVRNAPPENMLMHDWWIGLAAAAFGHIGFVAEPLNRYRQHGGNQLGAVNNRSIAGALRIISERSRTKKRVSATYMQAAHFLNRYGAELPESSRRLLEIYIDIPKHCKAARIYKLIKYRFLKQNLLTAVGQLIFC